MDSKEKVCKIQFIDTNSLVLVLNKDYELARAVNNFVTAMVYRLRQKAIDGYTGWDKPEKLSSEYIAERVIDNLFCANETSTYDIANYMMFLHDRFLSANVVGAYISKLAATSGKPMTDTLMENHTPPEE